MLHAFIGTHSGNLVQSKQYENTSSHKKNHEKV